MKHRGEGKSHMIDRLTQIYQLYDRIMDPRHRACTDKGCCTCNVTLMP